MKRLIQPLLVLAVVAFAALGINNLVSTNHKVELREVQLKSTTSDLKELQLQYDHLNTELDRTDATNAEQIKKLQDEKQQLEQQKAELEKQVSAKREAQRIAQEKISNTASLSGTAYAAGGSKDTWLAASGIPQSEWWAVDYIVSREAGWDPCAYNPGKSDCNANPSSACGLAQSLPCGKQARYGHWTDPVANLKWQYEYVKARYGGYAQAVAYWKVNHHY